MTDIERFEKLAPAMASSAEPFCGPLSRSLAALGCDDLARWVLARFDEEEAFGVAFDLLPAFARAERRAPARKETP